MSYIGATIPSDGPEAMERQRQRDAAWSQTRSKQSAGSSVLDFGQGTDTGQNWIQGEPPKSGTNQGIKFNLQPRCVHPGTIYAKFIDILLTRSPLRIILVPIYGTESLFAYVAEQDEIGFKRLAGAYDALSAAVRTEAGAVAFDSMNL